MIVKLTSLYKLQNIKCSVFEWVNKYFFLISGGALAPSAPTAYALVLDTTGRRRVKKAVVCVAQLVAALITVHGLLSFLSDVYGIFDPSGKTVWLSVDHRR